MIALLAGLSKDQFHPNDDPFETFLHAHKAAADVIYQRNYAKWLQEGKGVRR